MIAADSKDRESIRVLPKVIIAHQRIASECWFDCSLGRRFAKLAAINSPKEAPPTSSNTSRTDGVSRLGERRSRLEVIKGVVPNPLNLPTGCLFKRRCPYAMPICDTPPPLQQVEPGHLSRCWLTPDGAAAGGRGGGDTRGRRGRAAGSLSVEASDLTVTRMSEPFAVSGMPESARRRRDVPPPPVGPDRSPRGRHAGRDCHARLGRGPRQALRDPRRPARHPEDRGGPGRRRRLVRRPARRDARPRRRVGLRQDDARQGHPPAHPADVRVGSRSMAGRSSSLSDEGDGRRSGATCRSCSRTRTRASTRG